MYEKTWAIELCLAQWWRSGQGLAKFGLIKMCSPADSTWEETCHKSVVEEFHSVLKAKSRDSVRYIHYSNYVYIMKYTTFMEHAFVCWGFTASSVVCFQSIHRSKAVINRLIRTDYQLGITYGRTSAIWNNTTFRSFPKWTVFQLPLSLVWIGRTSISVHIFLNTVYNVFHMGSPVPNWHEHRSVQFVQLFKTKKSSTSSRRFNSIRWPSNKLFLNGRSCNIESCTDIISIFMVKSTLKRPDYFP